VHGVDFCQVTPKGASSSHLHPSDGLEAGSCLDQGCVARRLTGILQNTNRFSDGTRPWDFQSKQKCFRKYQHFKNIITYIILKAEVFTGLFKMTH
jgi:hypothetical protein